MIRAPRRTPTVQELAERVSRLENQITKIVKTVAGTHTSAVQEITEIRRALLDGRDELRRAFADTASRELVVRLHNELQGEIRVRHTEVMAQFETLRK